MTLITDTTNWDTDGVSEGVSSQGTSVTGRLSEEGSSTGGTLGIDRFSEAGSSLGRTL